VRQRHRDHEFRLVGGGAGKALGDIDGDCQVGAVRAAARTSSSRDCGHVADRDRGHEVLVIAAADRPSWWTVEDSAGTIRRPNSCFVNRRHDLAVRNALEAAGIQFNAAMAAFRRKRQLRRIGYLHSSGETQRA
jgi:hypothetical protein